MTETRTRVVDDMPQDWDQDSTELYGDARLFTKRVRETFDDLLEIQAEFDGVRLYRSGNQIIADENYNGWDVERRNEIVEKAFDWVIEQIESEENQ